MEIISAFTHINWLSVIVATLASFFVGSLWYSPLMFSKIWQRELKLSDEEIRNASMGLIFSSAFVLNFLAAIVLEMFLGKDSTLTGGLIAGLLVGIAWVTTALGTNYLFARKSFKLFLIDAGYFVVYYAVMGLILGVW
jgi:hypothetical protein